MRAGALAEAAPPVRELGLTEALAQFVAASSLELLQPEVRTAAVQAIVDCLGGALAGSTDAVARIAAAQAAPGRSGLWGLQRRAGARDAAFANACAAHAHAIDDTNESMRGHPSAPVLPAVFALAEDLGHSTEELLLAYVVGVEIAAKLGRAVNDHHSQLGWHTTCTLGSVGAAAGCARLLRLDARRTADALGIAASMASGLRVNFGTMTKALHAGLAAQNGVQAARLAEGGVTASAQALEGHEGFLELFCPGAHDARRALDALGAPLDVLSPGIVVKLYPTCSLMHALVDMVLAARQGHGGALPATIRCGISPRLELARGHRWPEAGMQAKFHVEYCVATAWLHGSQGLADFTDEAVLRPDVRRLAERIEVHVAPDSPPGNGDFATLCIERQDGTVLRMAQDKPRGHPTRPLAETERQAKFRQLAEPVLGAEGTRALWQALHRLDTHSLPQLTALLGCAAPSTPSPGA